MPLEYVLCYRFRPKTIKFSVFNLALLSLKVANYFTTMSRLQTFYILSLLIKLLQLTDAVLIGVILSTLIFDVIISVSLIGT